MVLSRGFCVVLTILNVLISYPSIAQEDNNIKERNKTIEKLIEQEHYEKAYTILMRAYENQEKI